jgi:hypothetical protein
MARDSENVFISKAARESWLLWFAVIGFFAVGGMLNILLSSFGLSERLVAEFALLVASLVLLLVLKVIVKTESPEVMNLVAGSAVLATQLLLSFIMKGTFAIGIAVGLFRLVTGLMKRSERFGRSSSDVNGRASRSIVLRSLLLGGLAFVISELAIRMWSVWRQ